MDERDVSSHVSMWKWLLDLCSGQYRTFAELVIVQNKNEDIFLIVNQIKVWKGTLVNHQKLCL